MFNSPTGFSSEHHMIHASMCVCVTVTFREIERARQTEGLLKSAFMVMFLDLSLMAVGV